MSLTRITMAALVFWGCGAVVPTPEFRNAPVRVISAQSRPAARESTLRIGSCSQDTFAVVVDDPDIGDTIRSRWFIDPDERYAGGVAANSGIPLMTGSTLREVRSSAAFMQQVAGLVGDGRKHRVEVVVTDGEFLEDAIIDPVTMAQKPYLKVTRPSIPLADGGTQLVEAFRDDYVWLVEVSSCP